ncbi:MAG: restriction endonuclease subunit S [Candidatus Methanomethylicaceae archaeon]
MTNKPSSFVNKKLGDIIELKYGKGLPKRLRKPGQFPVYGSGGVVDFHNEALVSGPGIVVGRKGSIGTVFYEKNDFYPIDTVFFVVPKSEDLDFYYLSKLLDQVGFQNLNTDAAVPGLNREVALQQEVKIPPILTQRKIAAILSAYDDLIENNLRRIKILEEMARTIYREWFVKFRFPGHEKVRMVDSPLGKIPEGWEVSTVGDNITVVSRKNKIKTSDYLTEGVIPVIDQGKDFIAGFVDDTSLAYDGPLPIIVFGDHTCVLKWVDFRFAVGADGTQLILPSHPEKLPPIFLFYTLQFLPIKQFGYQRHFKYLKEAKILLPPNSLTQKFNEVVNTQKNLILNLRLKNLNLRRTRDLLLPKLISGEIDVSELDIKIPDTERS